VTVTPLLTLCDFYTTWQMLSIMNLLVTFTVLLRKRVSPPALLNHPFEDPVDLVTQLIRGKRIQ